MAEQVPGYKVLDAVVGRIPHGLAVIIIGVSLLQHSAYDPLHPPARRIMAVYGSAIIITRDSIDISVNVSVPGQGMFLRLQNQAGGPLRQHEPPAA
ncbi:hypothetical protein D3C73_1236960 [compost metagenome]